MPTLYKITILKMILIWNRFGSGDFDFKSLLAHEFDFDFKSF